MSSTLSSSFYGAPARCRIGADAVDYGDRQ
jgi:hypothetical protein